jgi:hypothetical protein
MERDFQGRFSRSLSVLCACVVDLYLFVFIRVHSWFLSFICVNLRSSAVGFLVPCPPCFCSEFNCLFVSIGVHSRFVFYLRSSAVEVF